MMLFLMGVFYNIILCFLPALAYNLADFISSVPAGFPLRYISDTVKPVQVAVTDKYHKDVGQSSTLI
jgi:hypothetical protein